MRSFLTVLGVIIGTGTIIGVGSIIAGLDGAVTGVLRSFGTNTAIIFKFPIGFQRRHCRRSCGASRSPMRTRVAIAERCPSVESCQPLPVSEHFRQRSADQHRALQRQRAVSTPTSAGTEEAYAAGGQAEMTEGRFFTDAENQHRMPVAVVGADVPRALYERRRSHRQVDRREWPQIRDHRRDEAARRVVSRPGRYPHLCCRTSPCTSCSRPPGRIC